MKVCRNTNYFTSAHQYLEPFIGVARTITENLAFVKYAAAWYTVTSAKGGFVLHADSLYKKIKKTQDALKIPKWYAASRDCPSAAEEFFAKRSLSRAAGVAKAGSKALVSGCSFLLQLHKRGLSNLSIGYVKFGPILNICGNTTDAMLCSVRVGKRLSLVVRDPSNRGAWIKLAMGINRLGIAVLYAFSYTGRSIPLLVLKTIAFGSHFGRRLSPSASGMRDEICIPYLSNRLICNIS